MCLYICDQHRPEEVETRIAIGRSLSLFLYIYVFDLAIFDLSPHLSRVLKHM